MMKQRRPKLQQWQLLQPKLPNESLCWKDLLPFRRKSAWFWPNYSTPSLGSLGVCLMKYSSVVQRKKSIHHGMISVMQISLEWAMMASSCWHFSVTSDCNQHYYSTSSVAFIFNWIGFCLSFCITNTIAGRYGAICGFGLSLIKWILIVRFSDYFTGYFNGQYWLWWIFLVLGLLLFFRGFVNYLKVRNMSESMAAAHRTRFFFLY
ncbi:NEDD4 family-interacting protein 2 isoform 5-T5 [Phoenicopterus ruber ruber]